MPLLGPFDAVLFDMDGTLIDSTPAVRRSWARWGEEFGLAPDFRDGGGHGRPARDIAAQFVPPEQLDEAYARIVAIEIEEVSDITTLPGAAEALDALPEERRAIVTSSSRPLAAARIRASGINAPSVVVTSDDVTNGKPAPEPFELGARRLGFDPSRCLVVEDAHAGLASGRAAGSTTLGIAGTLALSQLDADAVVGSLADATFAFADGEITVTVP